MVGPVRAEVHLTEDQGFGRVEEEFGNGLGNGKVSLHFRRSPFIVVDFLMSETDKRKKTCTDTSPILTYVLVQMRIRQ